MKALSLRFAKPEDWAAIVALHRAQQTLQNSHYELPDLFGKHSAAVPVVLVTVDEHDVVQNAIYVERVAEMRFVGTDPKATAIARREIDGLSYLLQIHGYRWLECFVPRPLVDAIEKPLERAGFERKDDELCHFTRDLRAERMESSHE